MFIPSLAALHNYFSTTTSSPCRSLGAKSLRSGGDTKKLPNLVVIHLELLVEPTSQHLPFAGENDGDNSSAR
jgi:hypothetical protein